MVSSFRRLVWLPLAGALACAGPAMNVQLTDREGPRRHTIYRVDWRASIAPAFEYQPPFDIQQSRWEPLEVSAPVVIPEGDGTTRATVVAGGSTGAVKAFGLDGKPLWQFQGSGPMSSPGGDHGVVFIGSGDGNLYALQARDGALRWQYQSGEELGSAPVVAKGTVFIASHADTLFALDALTGKWKWHYRRDASVKEFSVRGVGTPLLVNDLVIQGFGDGSVVALRQSDGAVVWQHISTGGDQLQDADGSAQTDGHRVFVANYKEGISALAVEDGHILWQHALPTANKLRLGSAGLFASAVGKVVGLSPYDGSVLWEKGTGSKTATALAFAPGLLMVSTDGPLFFIDPRTGRPLGHTFNPGRGIAAGAGQFGGSLYVLSNNGWLYAMHLL